MTITEERLNEIQEMLADWKQADPMEVWDAFDFDDFNEMVSDLTDLLAEVHRLRAELAKTREVTDEKVERVQSEIYRQLSGAYGDFCTPSAGQAASVAAAALGGGDDS